MGHNGSRVLDIKNIQDHHNLCEPLGQRRCPIYGSLQCVNYKGMDFNIAQSIEGATPHSESIHYLILPGYLIFPDFTLLEESCPSSLEELLAIIAGVSQMALKGGHLGIGYNRICYNGRWGVAGQLPTDWVYRRVWQEGDTSGIFFSPQQMIDFSSGRGIPKHDPIKADTFAFGMMLVQIVFKEELGFIYDYENFTINLNPLLEKITLIKNEYGNEVASLFVGMLQIQEENRFDFQQLLEAVSQLQNPQQNRANSAFHMLNSNGSQRNLQFSRGNRPGNHPSPYTRTPKNAQKALYRNDVSPFRGRFGTNAKNNTNSRKTPERTQSRSPMRRQAPKPMTQNNFNRQDFQSMQRVSPLGRR